MSDNDSNDSFGNEVSNSIYFEDPNATEELSKLIMEDIYPEDEIQMSLNELEKNNELKIAYKKKQSQTDEEVRESFNDTNIKPTEKQYESNIKEPLLSKFKSNEINEEDNLYLKIEDFPENPIAELFYYSEAVDKIKIYIDSYENELKNMDINRLRRENIYQGKGVEIMVEETYGYDKYLKNQMVEEICYLKRIMNCWRRVAGDGNCFYRSAIFSWLEYLVFNKKITTLKIVMANLYTKFDPSYPKTKNLPLNLKKQFVTEERFLALTILEIIIRKLTNNDIMEAYLTLLKAFNVTRVFDRIMIFYLRFLLYEYISNNNDKLYKKDFPVLLGNLLPQEYETLDGKFLYDEYFKKDLLKYYTCAEKLAVYLTPFILKVNLNIVFYYFGNNCDIENKFFSCYLPNKDRKKDTINVLYRKAHYDVCYSRDYYNDFKPFLDVYMDLGMKKGVNYFIVDPDDIKKKEKYLNEISPFNPELSVVFNKLLFEKKEKEKKEKKEKEKENENVNADTNANTKTDTNKNTNTKDNIILKGISQKHSLNNCFICNKELKDDEGKKENLPCGCIISICHESCTENYYNNLCNFFNSMEFGINLKCGTCGNNINRIKIIENMNCENENAKNALKNKLFEYFTIYCMNCLSVIGKNKKYKKVKCKCQQLHKLLDTNKFEHKICEECSKNATGNCKICNVYHQRLAK